MSRSRPARPRRSPGVAPARNAPSRLGTPTSRKASSRANSRIRCRRSAGRLFTGVAVISSMPLSAPISAASAPYLNVRGFRKQWASSTTIRRGGGPPMGTRTGMRIPRASCVWDSRCQPPPIPSKRRSRARHMARVAAGTITRAFSSAPQCLFDQCQRHIRLPQPHAVGEHRPAPARQHPPHPVHGLPLERRERERFLYRSPLRPLDREESGQHLEGDLTG